MSRSSTCPASKHDTLTAYVRNGCRCDTAKAEHAEANARVRYRAQARTSHAMNYGTPWSPEDDRELLHGAGTLEDRATRLGRTWQACHSRLYNVLRPRVDPRASMEQDDPMTHPVTAQETQA